MPALTLASPQRAPTPRQVPEPRDGPFELTLDNWLGLFFIPKAKAVTEEKARKLGEKPPLS